ncbi:malate synthase A [Candidatus Peregrinibacteria bacterium]|nr:malate synthase A [Candidatus Peregrinibacteria bacterium]
MIVASPTSLEIRGPMREGFDQILTPDALGFVADLQRTFGDRIQELLEARRERQRRIDSTEEQLGFLPETQWIRDGEWTIAPIPADLQDRRVEITGPVDRKMMINALNSGANVFMADFEDSQAPTWDGLIQGQKNLRDAVDGSIAYDDPQSGKHYELGSKTATLAVRPRGLHLPEEHLYLDGKPVSGTLMDFGLAAYHNAPRLVRDGKTPFWYLPKLQSHKEAELWNDVFNHVQDRLAITRGTFKATVLIETFPAAFEMDEILYALKDHSAGLNCGRWDYIFSMIKTLHNRPWILPDRSEIGMTTPCMHDYSLLAINTCHRRGAHAMGGMAAQIPIKGDPAANEAALAKVRADKRREANDGHDGTWVAHPGLIGLAREEFDAVLQGRPNQIDRQREDVHVSAADLLDVPSKAPTMGGLRTNVTVAIQYLESWLRGAGCVPLNNLMEDAATAEISGAQVWHWLHHHTHLDDSTPVTADLVRSVIDEQMQGKFPLARKIFEEAVTAEEMPDFLTLRAYPHL